MEAPAIAGFAESEKADSSEVEPKKAISPTTEIPCPLTASRTLSAPAEATEAIPNIQFAPDPSTAVRIWRSFIKLVLSTVYTARIITSKIGL
jgi:hypothetical protein